MKNPGSTGTARVCLHSVEREKYRHRSKSLDPLQAEWKSCRRIWRGLRLRFPPRCPPDECRLASSALSIDGVLRRLRLAAPRRYCGRALFSCEWEYLTPRKDKPRSQNHDENVERRNCPL